METISALQTHLNRPPIVPSSCKQLWTDYATLARTRIKDIQEQTKGQEMLQGDLQIPPEIIDEVDKDIESAIISLETNGKLPQRLIQASIFRKPYFNGYFLPRLLTRNKGHPDSRTLWLIKDLRNKGKISETLFQQFNKLKEKSL